MVHTTRFLVIFCHFFLVCKGYWYWDGDGWRPCNCNRKSTTCTFDEELLIATGDGGRCTDCSGNTAGAHCEKCIENFYRQQDTEECVPCDCNIHGSVSPGCDHTGRCQCKDGISGKKCDQCPFGYFDFGPTGCRRCACSPIGTVENERDCQTGSNQCNCKKNVEGVTCGECKQGYFALAADNPEGCLNCFCNRHSSNCTLTKKYSVQEVVADFRFGRQGWSATDGAGKGQPGISLKYNTRQRMVFIHSDITTHHLYLTAPAPFLGKKARSHRLFLHFIMRVNASLGAGSTSDLILEGNGYRQTISINAQGNPIPEANFLRYKFRLSARDGWEPNLSDEEFVILLTNLTSLRIKGKYGRSTYAEFLEVRLEYASIGTGSRLAQVEKCACPESYMGDSCEKCAPGYHRDQPRDNPLSRCVPCDCHGHADACDVISGKCDCKHFTTGERCDRCLPGYYGDPRSGNTDDCKKCPCPFDGDCAVTKYGDIICTNCPLGYTGKDCTYCLDGYYGDPQARHYIIARPCRKCNCNENTDPNAIGFCDQLTGKCSKCSFNTTGEHCERCLPGFYGDAIGFPKGDCKPCGCHPDGTEKGHTTECDHHTGQCPCKENVIGRKCDECLPGHWDIAEGCTACDCKGPGVVSTSCDLLTGRCTCKEGFIGSKCDACLANWYRKSPDLCTQCGCHEGGSKDLQCDQSSGVCPCRKNALGDKCDKCTENSYSLENGCLDCPACYKLIRNAAINFRDLHKDTQVYITSIKNGSFLDFNKDLMLTKMIMTATELKDIYDEAFRKYNGTAGPPVLQIDEALKAIILLQETASKISSTITDSRIIQSEAENNVTEIYDSSISTEEIARKLSGLITKGEAILGRAKAITQNHGLMSEQMTSIAQEARGFSQLLSLVASNIANRSEAALQASTAAYRVVTGVGGQNKNVRRAIQDISINWVKKETNFRQGRAFARQVLGQASSTYHESVKHFSTVAGLRIRKFNLTNINNGVENVFKDSSVIQKSSQKLRLQYHEYCDMSEFLIMDSEDYLERATREGKRSNMYRNIIENASYTSSKAVAVASSIISDAQTTILILKDFDGQVESHRNAAKESLKNVQPAINQIRIAESRMRNATLLLDNSFDVAQEAFHTSVSRRNTAYQLLTRANTTAKDANYLRAKAHHENVMAEEASGQLKALTFQWADRERQNNMDRLLAAAALMDADETKEITRKNLQRVEHTLNSISTLLDTIDALGDLDLQNARLDRVEAKLNQIEESWMDSPMKLRVIQLDRSIQNQGVLINQFTNELLSLKNDVRYVKQIEESLPKTCYSTARLEPTNPG